MPYSPRMTICFTVLLQPWENIFATVAISMYTLLLVFLFVHPFLVPTISTRLPVSRRPHGRTTILTQPIPPLPLLDLRGGRVRTFRAASRTNDYMFDNNLCCLHRHSLGHRSTLSPSLFHVATPTCLGLVQNRQSIVLSPVLTHCLL